ncbi:MULTISPECIES: electron transfer flavoprotein subunit alpha/FixB family protein [Marinomonas]|uniref:Electron transfer flavoprotein subunit alpha/FixB family protein n=1 Tax=Marinomonas arctica TaxID=383750 RepID=A0A7H1J233_9GAMM|nr:MULTISPECIES: electron transfer flavoprotein subunit alpha/FixB family protein [Marinomonas]MCS7488206.1 electron transfer flavoprotein subunit alpha [Marinomonas sp. BSi20414]QNT04549.1 electron transfer flavoprotein subunit alpha/FixB family protein [Marinomonas arctica]GGN36863.1 electron transfer flavoprotein subunit alpha [Marinomonas arctica]
MSDFSSTARSLNNGVRRDPRNEWIARNRLHPLHDSVMSARQGEVRGPSGLLRKNPHIIGFIGPNGIKRIDRANLSSTELNSKKRTSEAQETLLPLHIVENPDGYIMVVADMVGGRLTRHDKDILGLAHQLATEKAAVAVVLVCFGENKETQFDLAGVDRLIHLAGQEFNGFAPEARLAALEQIETQFYPDYWLFPDSVNGGADLASRLAARLGERPATQAWQVNGTQTICRGASSSVDISRATPRILMLLEECADAIDRTRHQVLPLALDVNVNTKQRLFDQGQIAVDSNAVPLAEAEFILSAGNGIHNWDQFHAAAAALGATEGASRVAVDDGFMPRSRQVGASGTWVTARVYVAVGISGAIQHMQGIGQCDKVVAINTDAGCDMVKRADLAVIADSEEILAELTRLAQQHASLASLEEKSDAA